MTITANYKCDDREYTVEVIDTDGEDVTIACDVFPMVFVRHVGWCEQPTMTVNKKWIYNVRDTEAAELEQEQHKALQIVLDVTAPKDDPALQRLNKAAGYDIVTAICTTSPERKAWEAQYLAKRAARIEKYWSNSK